MSLASFSGYNTQSLSLNQVTSDSEIKLISSLADNHSATGGILVL